MALALTNSKPVFRAGSTRYPAVHHVQSEMPLPHLTSANQTGVVSWADSPAGGTFTPATGAATDYKPTNVSQLVTIVAADSGAGGTGSLVIAVTATFPIQPQVGYEIDLDDETKVEYMRDRTAYFQVEGGAFENRPLIFLDREGAERNTLRAFWLAHKKTEAFYYIDVETNLTYLARFTSGIKTRVAGADSYDMSCTISGDLV